MVEIKCRIVAEPQEGTRPIYRKNEPLIRGNYSGDLHYVCGNCTNLLAQNVPYGEISSDIVFQCPKCGAYNEV
jgi:DNA-directed RNA polymerase subunit RPC12/RpoP